MSRYDDMLKMIGLTVVAVIGLMIILGVLLFAFNLMGVSTSTTQNGSQELDKLRALNDYQYKLDLVKEQTQRIDMYYASKVATSMSHTEFQSWLETIRSLTVEFINRENNANEAGDKYLKYLAPGSDEYNRVVQNEAVSKDDIGKVKATYDGNVDIYNNQYGSAYGTMPHLSG